MSEIKRGEIYWTDLSPTIGSEQYGVRPTLVIQNDVGNKFSSTVIIAILTSVQKKQLPTHVLLNKDDYNLDEDSVVMLEQIRTIDKWRIGEKITVLDKEKMREIDNKLMVSLGIDYKQYEMIG
ncbi:type II toxin-antitoxin system PemK/MazF family toxin [Heyndrickxia oleronia]|uniref:type II toxin-antitoxin system PemK/MazF family toxin n=1 Tax=Heyndrickxia oleronia TaxID=38875 RepID=UPI00203E8F79|nr:type II toxin-antitoxin system PemK/MazF family toxin [Heyndrickxia oleronia]MCM3454470.1 type II toxin-antitoxin system PemK/MazF family toxin [Heyndrickxia oleronia]